MKAFRLFLLGVAKLIDGGVRLFWQLNEHVKYSIFCQNVVENRCDMRVLETL